MSVAQWVSAFDSMGFDEGILAPNDVDYFLNAARMRAGLSDFGDDHFLGPLKMYLKAIQNARLSLIGRMIKLREVLLLLENRLRIEDELARNPQILDQNVDKPIFIVSLPRAGSSILFELMSQKSGIRKTLYWEAVEPCPPPDTATYDTDPRIKTTEPYVESWNIVAPEFRGKHLVGTTVPVECLQAQSFSFVSNHLVYATNAEDYQFRLTSEDWLYCYSYYRRILKLLQWKTKNKQWLLKSPVHLNHFMELLTVFPDARIVLLHRDPATTIASTGSIQRTVYRDVFGAPFDESKYLTTYYVDSVQKLLAFMMKAYDEWREKGATIVNAFYKDVVSSPVETVTQVYNDIGLSLTKQDQDAVARYVANRPKDKYGKHSYGLPSDIDANVLREKFSPYMAKFNVEAEPRGASS